MGALDLPGPQGQTLIVGAGAAEDVLIPAEKAREPVRALGTLPSESLEPSMTSATSPPSMRQRTPATHSAR